jgi:hypothetical protein
MRRQFSFFYELAPDAVLCQAALVTDELRTRFLFDRATQCQPFANMVQ